LYKEGVLVTAHFYIYYFDFSISYFAMLTDNVLVYIDSFDRYIIFIAKHIFIYDYIADL